MRKIVHIDMDAFYASVEQRDNPALRGRPVVVAWKGPRSVVCAASYEARAFGVRSAMPALRALRLCPKAVFVPPDFARYKAVSMQVRAIFERHTALIEPLSLDEAYLDVGSDLQNLGSATAVARAIRASIVEELALTASAGVAPNKFVAKIASEHRKPDGLFVVPPPRVLSFLAPLPVARLPGVGQVMADRLARLAIHRVGELRAVPTPLLVHRFGRWGLRLAELARGIDEAPVVPTRTRQSLSAEDTFAEDHYLDELGPSIRRLAERVWAQAEREIRRPRTVQLKLKTAQFQTLTRSISPEQRPGSAQALAEIALALRERIDAPPRTRYRLVGVGLAQFEEAQTEQQPPLFAAP
ncbi:DNA polymerase IV [Silanimonas sp.]|uniref:DNA polymerase IV n=1 Tax=Silanimonas sp. TaxID=1929290 RepID=UPI001BC626E4|nr:DNA polymerase IV [Silanimonas sp.]MBS3895863.1 DNA polymerase IV [Silanimonas sp.]MBS3924832.1 DNA polymerase IV [Xanthomonadaceae bacterium]